MSDAITLVPLTFAQSIIAVRDARDGIYTDAVYERVVSVVHRFSRINSPFIARWPDSIRDAFASDITLALAEAVDMAVGA